jgi:hypothetical protein
VKHINFSEATWGAATNIDLVSTMSMSVRNVAKVAVRSVLLSPELSSELQNFARTCEQDALTRRPW